ncbi:hypothetical protein [Ignatzschineria indica]|nr:hypothetical protein [Ignatzschineria indica]
MSGFFILKKVRGAAGTDYIALFAGACPLAGIFDASCRHIISERM